MIVSIMVNGQMSDCDQSLFSVDIHIVIWSRLLFAACITGPESSYTYYSLQEWSKAGRSIEHIAILSRVAQSI